MSLLKIITVTKSEAQIYNLKKGIAEILHNSYRLNINQTQSFDTIVTIEILRVPQSEKGNKSSYAENLITEILDCFCEINKANSTLNDDEKNTKNLL